MAERPSMQFYRARYYNPQYGRFVSEDPIGLAGGLNEYAYVYDNPSNFIDSVGLSPNSVGNFPDCGVDCVRTPAERAAIERAHEALMLHATLREECGKGLS